MFNYVTNKNFRLLHRREVFPDGILYASRDSHYSVFKAARMYRMDCIKVDALNSGVIDCEDFKTKLLQNKDKPAIINVNIGELTSRLLQVLIFNVLKNIIQHDHCVMQGQL